MNNHPLKESGIRYLVLESRERKPLVQALYENSESPAWEYLFAETEWQPYMSESPLVIEMLANSTAYSWAMEMLESGRFSGLILESQHGLRGVTAWLRERLTVRFDGRRMGLLRLYDPLIWHRLTPVTRKDNSAIECVWYWHGTPNEQRWLVSKYPEPVTMLPVPSLEEHQWLALNSENA